VVAVAAWVGRRREGARERRAAVLRVEGDMVVYWRVG